MANSKKRQQKYREAQRRRGWEPCATYLLPSHRQELERLRRERQLPGLHDALAVALDAGLNRVEPPAPEPVERDEARQRNG